MADMALTGTAAAPACLLLLLAFLPSWGTQTGPQEKPLTGSFVEENATPSSLTTQETTFPNSSSVSIGNQLHSTTPNIPVNATFPNSSSVSIGNQLHSTTPDILVNVTFPNSSSVSIGNQLHSTTPNILVNATFPNSSSVSIGNQLHSTTPNILVNATGRHNKVKGAGNKEDTKERTLLSDRNAEDGGSSVRTTTNALNVHSADNSSETQIDTYDLKDSREIPEVHIVAGNITSQDSGELKDGGVQVVTNSSMNKKVKNVPEKGRRNTLLKPDPGMTGKSTTENNKRNLPVTGSFVEESATPSSLTTQETTFPNSSSVSIGNQLHSTTPNILVNAPGRHNKVKSAETKEDILERILLSDRNAEDNGDRSVRTTTNALNVHSADNSSKTQLDIYNLKDSRKIPEVHIVAGNITSQGFKIDSRELKDGGVQVVTNSPMNKKVKHVPEKGRRKALLKPDLGMTEKSTIEDSKRNLPVTERQIQVPHQRHLILEHELPKKQDKSKKVHMRVLKVLKPLKVIYMEKPTSEPLIFEETNPTVTKDHKNRLQSLMKQQAAEISVKVLEKLLCFLKKEEEMQKSLSPYEKMQSSIMENILQELKEKKGPGEADSSEVELKITLKPFLEESSTVPDSNEILLEQSTTVPNMTDEDVKDAKSLEYEGAEDEKKAKAAGVRDLLKDVIIACVAITALILAVIVLVHICISLFVKKKQEPV